MKKLLFVLMLSLGAFINHVNCQEEDKKEDPPFAAFELDSLIQELDSSEKPWLSFFRGNDVLTGLYRIKAGGIDRQKPHDTDEVYYVVSGESMFIAGGKEVEAKAGSIFYVKKEVDHRFFDIVEDLVVVVFFDQ